MGSHVVSGEGKEVDETEFIHEEEKMDQGQKFRIALHAWLGKKRGVDLFCRRF